MTTILADQHPNLTPDERDAAITALHEASTTSWLHPTDRDALRTLLVHNPGLTPVEQDVVVRIISRTTTVPLDMCQAAVLHNLAARLAGPPETSPVQKILHTLAAHVAEHELEPGGLCLRRALQASIRAGRPDIDLADAPAEADRLVGQARRDLMAAEYGDGEVQRG